MPSGEPTSPSLAGARIKLARAARHLDELGGAARAYLDLQPFQVVRQEEPSGDLVYRLRVARQVPLEWGAIVGDIVHNIRAALDLLAWQVVAAAGAQPGRDTAFPIARDRAAFEQMLGRTLRGATARALRFIRHLRPYSGGNEVLAQLHALDIVDKHRVILVVGATHKHVVMQMRMRVPWQEDVVAFPPIAINPADRQFPLLDGAEIYRVRAQARSAEILDEPRFTFEICFGDTEEVQGKPFLETLSAMHMHVERIVALTDRFLL